LAALLKLKRGKCIAIDKAVAADQDHSPRTRLHYGSPPPASARSPRPWAGCKPYAGAHISIALPLTSAWRERERLSFPSQLKQSAQTRSTRPCSAAAASSPSWSKPGQVGLHCMEAITSAQSTWLLTSKLAVWSSLRPVLGLINTPPQEDLMAWEVSHRPSQKMDMVEGGFSAKTVRWWYEFFL